MCLNDQISADLCEKRCLLLLLVLLFLAGTRGLLARQTPHETKIASLTQPVAPSNGRPQAVVVKGIVTGLSGWKNSFFLQDKIR